MIVVFFEDGKNKRAFQAFKPRADTGQPVMSAAQGEDAAERHRPRRDRVPPAYPKGVSGSCTPVGSALKLRLKFLSSC
jgi:hypothetical protein